MRTTSLRRGLVEQRELTAKEPEQRTAAEERRLSTLNKLHGEPQRPVTDTRSPAEIRADAKGEALRKLAARKERARQDEIRELLGLEGD